MIDKKSIEVYKSIKAPERMRERILSFEKESCDNQDTRQTGFRKQSLMKAVRPVIAVAACVVLIIGIAMPLGNSQAGVDIFVNGTRVGETPVCISKQEESEIATARMMDVVVVPITINQDEEAALTVTKGILQLVSENGEVVEEAASVQKEAQQKVCWILDGLEPDEMAILTITGKESRMTYQAYKEETSSLYYITLKEKVELQ